MSIKATIYTDGGSSNLRGKWYGGWGFAGTADDGTVFSGYGGCTDKRATNNIAEQDAYLRAGQYALSKGYTEVTFKLDSKYVLSGSQKFLKYWENNDWRTKNGEPLKNKHMWLQIKGMQAEFVSKGLTPKYEWVKGHSGIEGNELADKGATLGKRLAMAGDFTPVYAEQGEEAVAEIKKVKQTFSRSLFCRRLLTVTNEASLYREASKQFVFYQTNFNDKSKARSKYLGRTGTDVLEAVTLTDKPIPVLDTIQKVMDESLSKKPQIPAVIQWDKISSKKKFAELTVRGEACLSTVESDVMMNGDELLAYPVKTPLISFMALTSLDGKFALLEEYLEGNIPSEKIVDITEEFFTANKKGKQIVSEEAKIKSTFVVATRYGDKVCEACLIPGVNMPQLVKLGSISKESDGMVVKLLLHDTGKKTFRFSIIMECGDGDVTIADCPYSAVRKYKSV